MREEKLDEIKEQIKKLKNARRKYIGRKKRIEKLSEDPKVKEYIKLKEQQEKAEKIIKDMDDKVSKCETDKIIINYVFKKGIEKMPIEETNGVYLYQGVRPMGDRIYHKYQNFEKERAIFVLEENNEEFKKNNIIIGLLNNEENPQTEQVLYNYMQNDFFEKMYNEGEEEAKKYVKNYKIDLKYNLFFYIIYENISREML